MAVRRGKRRWPSQRPRLSAARKKSLLAAQAPLMRNGIGIPFNRDIPIPRGQPISLSGYRHHITKAARVTTRAAHRCAVTPDITGLSLDLLSEFSDRVGQGNHTYGVPTALGRAADHQLVDIASHHSLDRFL